MHFDEEMGFQHLGPGITVLSPSDPRPPTVLYRNQEAYQLRYVFGYAMEGSFGRSVLQNNPSGALMLGKVIGFGWTHVPLL